MVGGEILAVIGQQGMQVAERPILQQLADHIIFRRVIAPHCLQRQLPLAGGFGLQLTPFAEVEREGLLNQHVFTRLQRLHAVGKVMVVRRRNVHRINIRARQHLLHLAVSLGDPPFRGHPLGLRLAAGGHRHHLLPAVGFQCMNKALGDPARTDNAPAQGGNALRRRAARDR